MDAFGGGSVGGTSVGAGEAGAAVGGENVGKPGSDVGVEGSGVLNNPHASNKGTTNKIE